MVYVDSRVRCLRVLGVEACRGFTAWGVKSFGVSRVQGFGFGSLVSGSLLWNLAGLRRLLACTVYTTQGSIVELKLKLAGCKFFG